MNEVFTMELDLSPFVTEVFTDTEPIARLLRGVDFVPAAV
jgi:hypothetical protein